MTYALNEVEALTKRAARGAGRSWGMAEEAAKAVRWLAAHGMPSLAPFAQLLNGMKATGDAAPKALEGRWQAAGDALCPLICGAALCDLSAQIGRGREIEMEQVLHPVLLAPFAAFVAKRSGRVVVLRWDDLALFTDGDFLWVMDPKTQIETVKASQVACSLADTPTGSPRELQTRCAIDPTHWDILNGFAQRTYAPATEQSRMLGAGAGNSDND